ncbi:MAG: helix-turn-helix domain-containing protein [Candidatus Omnitrophica bacterium]|nr:helix-turn-helix domain-containing protein [Candidatus Omnitrophota bacterium]
MKKISHKEKVVTPESVSQHIEEQYKKSSGFRKAFDEEVFMLKIAYRIAQLRKQRHITQRELARKMGTTQQTISRLEDSENTQVTLHTLTRLARALRARLSVDLIPRE